MYVTSPICTTWWRRRWRSTTADPGARSRATTTDHHARRHTTRRHAAHRHGHGPGHGHGHRPPPTPLPGGASRPARPPIREFAAPPSFQVRIPWAYVTRNCIDLPVDPETFIQPRPVRPSPTHPATTPEGLGQTWTR